jgi:predicted dehydrogenase
MLGVAVVGTGFGQKVHIPGFKAHHHTEVVAVYHRDINKAKAIATTYNIPFASDRLTEILAQPEVQAVSISTPPFLHYEMAEEVLKAGKHLLLEKPIALNATQAKALYQLVQERNLVTTVDFEFRFVPGWQYFAQLLDSGFVGQLRLIKIDWFGSSRADPALPWNWYSAQELGGGVLGSLGSHTFDYIHWLFGQVRRLNAHLSTAIPTRIDPASGIPKPVSSDDICLLSLELIDGTPCQIALSAVVHASRTHWLEVYGDRGTLVVGSNHQTDYIHGFRVWGSHIGQPLTELDIPSQFLFPHNYGDGRISAFVRVVDQWVKGIVAAQLSVGQTRRQQVVPSLSEGVYTQLLMDLSHRSHALASWVDVPSLADFLG